MSTLEESVEFTLNAQPRCPCVLILDTSGSMAGDPINALNSGLQTLHNELFRDEVAKKRVEIAVVEFNSSVRVVQDFVTVEDFRPPTLAASGTTDLVGGVNQAFDLLQYRKRQYHSNGVPYYRPWAFLITDGQVVNHDVVASRIREEEKQKGVAFFVVGVGNADEDSLKQISIRPHKMLAGLKFNELFLWLSSSLQSVAQSVPGEMVALDKNTGAWELI